MINEAFTEIEDFSYYNWIYFNEDNLNENNNKNNIFINDNNYYFEIEDKKNEKNIKKGENLFYYLL